MDAFQSLMMGFSIALTPQNLMFAFVGSIIGTLVGVLPGVGPAAGIAILIPVTFQLDATGAIIMLCAIFYGTQYGGTITSVLMNVPGEASSAVTCIDGYQMAKQGRAGAALSIPTIGALTGGPVAPARLVSAAGPLAGGAPTVGPAGARVLLTSTCLYAGGAAVGPAGDRPAVAQRELSQYGRRVRLDGLQGDEQLGRDLLVGVAPGQ